MGVLILEGSCL